MELRPFKNIKQDREIPNNPGIYILFQNDEVIYVGQSRNIRQRLFSHYNHSQNINQVIKQRLKCMYCEEAYKNKFRYINYKLYLTIGANIDNIYYVYNEFPIEELNEKEYYYIQKHQPKYNVEGILKPYVGVKVLDEFEKAQRDMYKHQRIERHLDKLYKLGRKQEK